MMRLGWSFVLLVVVVRGTEQQVDTKRDAVVLETGAVTTGTYVDSMNMHMTMEQTISGQKYSTVMDMSFECDKTVVAVAGGGREVDTKITRVSMDVAAMGQHMHCDSKEATTNEACQPLTEVVGTSQHFVIDDEGQIAQQSGGNVDPAAGNVSPAQQLEETSRLLKFMPTHPVAPGDSWDASVDMPGMGSFTGKATLRGYIDYEGHDCAVLVSEGIMKLDIQKAIEKMGLNTPGIKDITVSDVDLTTAMYWDNEIKIMRWASITESFVMEMPNPMDGSKMTVPVDEAVTMKSDIKG